MRCCLLSAENHERNIRGIYRGARVEATRPPAAGRAGAQQQVHAAVADQEEPSAAEHRRARPARVGDEAALAGPEATVFGC